MNCNARQLWQLLIIVGLVVAAIYFYQSYQEKYGGDYKMTKKEKIVVGDEGEVLKRTVTTKETSSPAEE